MPARPSDHELLLEAIRSQLARVNTALPGVVVAYDRATQAATVRPVFKFKYRDPDDPTVIRNYEPGAIANAPVCFPGGGGFSITWDLEPGDPVLLVFSGRSLDEWRTVAGDRHELVDPRRFDLSDAIVVPGLRSPASAHGATAYAAGALVVAGDDIRLGSSAAADFVALASLVRAELDALWSAMNTHTHSGVTTGVGTTGVSGTVGSAGDVAAQKVKAE